VFVLLLTITLARALVANFIETGINSITDLLDVSVFSFLILVLFNIWLLTSSTLPIIKIDEHGIKAYSIFWNRKIIWSELKAARILRCQSHLTAGPRARFNFEYTAAPQQQDLVTRKGVKVTFFIVVSRQAIKPKTNLTLSSTLFSHSKLSSPNEIVFEYEPLAWQAIQAVINNVYSGNIKKLDD
jgi:hypothetical protein